MNNSVQKCPLTVPATDFDDMKVLALNLDNPKSQTYISKTWNPSYMWI